MNFSTYSLYVGNNRKFTEFKGYGDYVTLRSDSSNVRWSISDADILEFKSVSGREAEVRAIRTGFAYVCAEKEDGTRELCHISVIDNYTRLTTERIELNTDKLNLKPGAEARVIPVLYPKEVYNNGMLDKRLSWSSSDTTVADVEDGVVKAVGEGEATITMTSADVGRRASVIVSVSADFRSCDIKAGANKGSMTVGERLQLEAETKSNVVWRSDNSIVADVDMTGVVTAYSKSGRLVVSDDETAAYEVPDTVKIYATAVDGGKTAEFILRVDRADTAVHSVDINKKKLTVVNGKTAFITAVITPANILEKQIEWSSSDDSVVSASAAANTADGVNRARITARSAGCAYITASYGGKCDRCLVTVTENEIKIKEIIMPAAVETEVDKTFRMNASITENAADGRLIWLGTDDDIASVDRDGNIMGYRAGDISVYAIARDSLTGAQAEEIKRLKRSGKRQFTRDELSAYLGVHAVCKLTVRDDCPSLRNVHIPEESVMCSSVNILWSRAAKCDVPELDRYNIYVNGRFFAETNKLGHTVCGLDPDKLYSFRIAAVDGNGNEIAAKCVEIKTKPAPSEIINVLERGAKGNGRVLDTYAIQRAIDNCPEHGEVVLPEGYIFRTGALFLKSDMTFRVDGVLIGSIDPKDYPPVITRWEGWRKLPQTAEEWDNTEDNPEKPYMRENKYQHSSLINAGTYNEDAPGTVSPCNVRNITICGRGQINSNGFALAYNEGPNWKRHKENDFYRAFPPVKNPTLRGRTLAMNNAERVYVKDVQISYAPSWTTHFIFCSNVTFDGLSVISQGHGNAGDGCDLHNCIHIYNGDGIDPEDCTYVNIFNSYFRTGDDTVTLKSGRNREGNELDKPNAYIRVTDCVSSWSLGGFGTGSEDASGSHDLLYQNLSVYDAEVFGYWFKTNPARGCITENVQVRDCYAEGVKAVLVFSHEYPSGQNNPADGLPVQRHFIVENISGKGSEYSIRLNGLNEASITDVSLRAINCDSPNGIDITNCDIEQIRWSDKNE